MKKWYMWLVLGGIWVLAGTVNWFEHRPLTVIIYNLFAAALFFFLGAMQYFCDKKGESGKKIMKLIYISALLAMVIFLVIVLLI